MKIHLNVIHSYKLHKKQRILSRKWTKAILPFGGQNRTFYFQRTTTKKSGQSYSREDTSGQPTIFFFFKN